MRTARLMKWAILPGIGIVMAGCPAAYLNSLPDQVNLPPAAEFLAANAAQFKQIDGEAPPVEPGTFVDELTKIDGCWGNLLVDQGRGIGSLAIVLHFDAAAGTYERIQYVGAADGTLARLFPLVTIDRGSFAIVDDSTIRLTTETTLSNFSPDDSKFGSDASFAAEIGAPVPVDHPATLDGDTLILGFDDPNESVLVMRPFDCPQ